MFRSGSAFSSLLTTGNISLRGGRSELNAVLVKTVFKLTPQLRRSGGEHLTYLAIRSATLRMKGAAVTTTGSMVSHETLQDVNQWGTNMPPLTNGMLAIPAAIPLVSPD